MRILSIDSSTPQASVAMLDNQQIIAQSSPQNGYSYSNSLLSSVHQVLTDCGKTLHDADCFALTTGPGSFTGLRVGVSLVKGFVLATQKPFVGVSTLLAFASLAEATPYRICPILDARKGEIYAAFFKYNGDRLERLSPDAVIPPGVLAGQVSEPTIFLGTGMERYGKFFTEILGVLFAGEARVKPHSPAAAAALIAQSQYHERNSLDLDSLNIEYIRKSEAEINFRS